MYIRILILTIKLVDPQGEMLEATWESMDTRLANWKEIPTQLELIVEQFSIPESDSLEMIGCDTRLSSLASLPPV